MARTTPMTEPAARLILCCAIATASAGEPLFTINAASGDAGDEFGASLAIADSRLLVGAARDEPLATGSGSAYLYDLTTGAQIRRFVPADGEQYDFFGTSVAIGPDALAIGAINDDDAGGNAGAVYIYDTASGNLLRKLTAPDGAPGDAFGSAVAIAGPFAIVASPLDDPPTNMGSVYIFDLPAGTFRHKVIPADTPSDKRFGESIAANGVTLAIGAPRDREASASGVDVVGAVYLYDIPTGSLLRKVLPPDGEPFDRFGTSVDLDDGLLIVGAPQHQAGGIEAGAAYIFDATTGTLLTKIIGDAPFILSGVSVALDLDSSPPIAAVGANDEDGIGTDAGAVFLYDITDPIQPIPINTLRPILLSEYDGFGTALDIDAGFIAAGAPGSDLLGFDSGTVFVFELGGACNPADIADPQGTLDLADIAAFVAGFTAADPIADLVPDGQFDLADITAFVNAFTAGCP